jgi:hypothetical protein
MKCSRCGHDNRDAAKFCDECATLARSGVTWWRLDLPYWVIGRCRMRVR